MVFQVEKYYEAMMFHLPFIPHGSGEEAGPGAKHRSTWGCLQGQADISSSGRDWRKHPREMARPGRNEAYSCTFPFPRGTEKEILFVPADSRITGILELMTRDHNVKEQPSRPGVGGEPAKNESWNLRHPLLPFGDQAALPYRLQRPSEGEPLRLSSRCPDTEAPRFLPQPSSPSIWLPWGCSLY